MYARLCLLLVLGFSGCTVLFLPDAERIPTTVVLDPTELSVKDQESATINVTVLDHLGDPFEKLPASLRVEWSLSDSTIAGVDNGKVTGQRPGTGAVRVKVGDLAAAAKLRVVAVPRRLRAASDTVRAGVVGRPLASPVVVRVVDRAGAGVPEVPVSFKVTAGAGSVRVASTRSDSLGFAATIWTLGSRAGENTLEVTSSSFDGGTVHFAAIAASDAAARLELVSGNLQQATAGATLAQELVVRVFDRNGNLAAFAPVAWQSGDGSVVAVSPLADGQGIARARWTLDTRARKQSAVASTGGSEVRFAATATAGPASRVRIGSGDGQFGQEFGVLPDSLSVIVTDDYGNPVSGAPVSWAVTHGGGIISTARPAVSRSSGVATAAWTVGVSLPNAATATVAGQVVTFGATVRPSVPRDTLRTESGLQYMEIDVPSDSLAVRQGNWVSIHYSAYLLDGTLVHRTQATPLRFVVGSNQVIKGFDEGVVGMRIGSSRRLIVSPELGYRDGELKGVPPGSTLVFDVKLVELK